MLFIAKCIKLFIVLASFATFFHYSFASAFKKMILHKLCMIPGPIEFHEDVLAAMGTPATSHVDPNFIPIFGESIEMIRDVVMTETAQPFIVSGSGTLGWDMMVNLVEQGDEVLALNTGYFGDHFAECLEVYGAKITTLRADVGSRPSIDELTRALENKKYKLVVITHVDTSTGVLSDIKAVSQTIKSLSPETLVVVDGVCSVGSEEIQFDNWGLDVMITGSQKGLGVPPGLSIVVVSQKALEVFNSRKTPVQAYFTSWKKWLPIMQAYESRKPGYFATPAVQLIYALHTSLKMITSKSMEYRIEKHRQVATEFRDVVHDLGLKTVAQSEDMSAHGMTAIWVPEGIEVSSLVSSLASKGVQIAGGILDGLAGKYFRIGHMGISVMEPERGHIEKVVKALKSSLKELGYKP